MRYQKTFPGPLYLRIKDEINNKELKKETILDGIVDVDLPEGRYSVIVRCITTHPKNKRNRFGHRETVTIGDVSRLEAIEDAFFPATMTSKGAMYRCEVPYCGFTTNSKANMFSHDEEHQRQIAAVKTVAQDIEEKKKAKPLPDKAPKKE